MIVKLDKQFKNFYASDRKIKKEKIDKKDFFSICSRYFDINDCCNDIENTIENFKIICSYHFLSNYIFNGSANKDYYLDYNYLYYRIKEDVMRYIQSDLLKFEDIFYHPLNSCIFKNIFKKDVLIDSYYYDNNCYNNKNYTCLINDLLFSDSSFNCQMMLSASILFKYKFKDKNSVLNVCFMKSNDYVFLPFFTKMSVNDYEKHKNKVLKYLDLHKELSNISTIKDFEFPNLK